MKTLFEAWKTKSGKILILVLSGAVFLNTCFCINAIGPVFENPTPHPTQDLLKLQSLAVTKAWLSYTMTALALPTNTAIPTNTPLPTYTSVPTFTQVIYPTATATMFFSKLPINQTQVIVTYPTQDQSLGCCKHCTNSQPCGDSCISLSKTCHQPTGCACK